MDDDDTLGLVIGLPMNSGNRGQAVWVPVDPADIPSLEHLLSRERPFVSAAIDTAAPYRLLGYVEHAAAGGDPVRAVFDRNLVSRVVRLAKGSPVDHSKDTSRTDRVAAACMAFLAAGRIEIEPNIALYELALSEGGDGAINELYWFRLADAIQPQAYLNVALKRASEIHPEALREASGDVRSEERPLIPRDFETALRHWRCHRAVLTKVAVLERAPLPAADRFRQLLRWSLEPGFFDALALTFAAVFFGQRRQGGMLKGVRSDSLERSLQGIANAAWDLTYISHWLHRASGDQGRAIWLFCTHDRICATLARCGIGPVDTTSTLFGANYGDSDARSLYREYCDLSANAEKSDRAAVLAVRCQTLDAQQQALDEELAAAVRRG